MLHTLLVILVFVPAIYDPERSGMLPLFIFTVDFPASLLLIQIHSLYVGHIALRVQLSADAVLFLIGGALWFYMFGWVVVKGRDLIWPQRKADSSLRSE